MESRGPIEAYPFMAVLKDGQGFFVIDQPEVGTTVESCTTFLKQLYPTIELDAVISTKGWTSEEQAVMEVQKIMQCQPEGSVHLGV